MIARLRLISFAVLACASLAGSAVPAAADDSPSPTWLSAPFTQGPVAGTFVRDARGLWWGVDGTLPLAHGSADQRAPLQRAPALGLGLFVAGDTRTDLSDLRYTGLLDRRNPQSGQWLGLSAGHSDGGARLHLGAGLWRWFSPIQFEAGVVTSVTSLREQQTDHWGFYRQWGLDSLVWVDTTTFRSTFQKVLNTTAQSGIHWQLGRLEVSAMGGVLMRSLGGPARWAQATVNLQATRSVLLMAAFGQRPAPSLAFDPSAGPSTMLGVRITPWASRGGGTRREGVPNLRAWSARPLAEGRMALRVRCGSATRVELAGDFTDWAPVALEALGGGWWGGELAIAPGLHQVQIRLDGGAWQAPPGLPATHGDFAGTAGVLVVE